MWLSGGNFWYELDMSIAVTLAVLWDVVDCSSSDRRQQVLEDAMLEVDSWLSEAAVGKSSGSALSLLSMQAMLSMHASSMSSCPSTSLTTREDGFGSCGQCSSYVAYVIVGTLTGEHYAGTPHARTHTRTHAHTHAQ